jgi:hypothetical protein
MAGSKTAPNLEVVFDLRARYPSMLSVSIAKRIAIRRSVGLSIRKTSAKGALKRDKLFDKLNMELISFPLRFFSFAYTKEG